MAAHQTYSGDHLEKPAHEPPTIVSDVPSRQGVTGHNVRYVLLFGTAGAVAALMAAMAMYFY